MLEVMIDLETLDTEPHSAVLSIGAVLFDEGGFIGSEPFFRTLELDQQFKLGRTVSQATLFWWGEQSDAAWHKSFNPEGRDKVYHALDALNHFVKPAECIWANSPSFDCIILETLYREMHLDVPWFHNQRRDMRTLREEAGVPRDWEPPSWSGVAHDPVHDCRFQIDVVVEARKRIRSCL